MIYGFKNRKSFSKIKLLILERFCLLILYFVYPCLVETSRESILLLWSFYTLFYPLSFWDKKGKYFLIWTGIVFLTGQVFLSHNG
jgi:hypothetical protein